MPSTTRSERWAVNVRCIDDVELSTQCLTEFFTSSMPSPYDQLPADVLASLQKGNPIEAIKHAHEASSPVTNQTALHDCSFSEHASEAELLRVSEGVFAHGRAQATDGDARPIVCVARYEGDVIAGGSGRTEYQRLFVQYLWVAERFRARGLGTEILTRLEASARQRNCKDAIIETLDSRTARLYTRLGYVEVAAIQAYVGAFCRRILVKPLRETGTA